MADEIVNEIRRIREEIAARFNHDLDAIYRYYKQLEKESGRQYVNLVRSPKKLVGSRALKAGAQDGGNQIR